MRLRTQLALTFLALTILPLGGLAAYSYYSSSKAVRAALEEEAGDLAREMDQKLNVAREWVARSVANVDPITLDSIVSHGATGDQAMAVNVLRNMGTAATLVRSLEFVPFQESHSSGHSEVRVGVNDEAPPAPPAPSTSPAIAATPPTPPAPPVPAAVIIDVREALREVEAERQVAAAAPVVGESLEFAFKALDSIPLDMILQQSMSAMEQGLEQAEREIRIENENKGQELRSAEAEQRTLAIARAREALAERRELSDSDHRSTRSAPEIPVVRNGEVVGSVRANVREEEILREIFLRTAADGDEIPFAIDASGTIYARSDEGRELVESLGIPDRVSDETESSRFVQEDWIVATSRDAESGLLIGVLRPAAEAISEVRRATLRSLGFGLALVGICLIGILPLANHMTRDVTAVTAGAERVAHGELDTEVPVRSRNEVGRLAMAFNRMSSELKTNQQRLVNEEAARREQEVREQLLKKEYERTTGELEDARQFQLSMLPSTIPQRKELEIAVEMSTATEVGGDYYDFHSDQRGLTVAIGDGTGHGAKAGTMVAVIKSLFMALRSVNLATFLSEASTTIRSMQLGRMSMALTLLRIENGTVRFAAAGMPPVLLLRRDGGVEELGEPGAPLGTIEFPYEEREVDISDGDVLVAMSDGLPELLDHDGEPFGYEKTIAVLQQLEDTTPAAVIAALQDAAREWRGERPQNDDMTLLVMRYLG